MGLVAIDPFAVAIAARSPAVESLAVIFGHEGTPGAASYIVNNRW